MMSHPLVSVLMPAYNAADFISEAIESILDQTYTSWELLIADDKSTDQTLAKIRAFNDPRIRVIENPENLGYLKTTNLLFGLASGEFITFLDADDWSAENRIMEQISYLQEHLEIDVLGTGFQTVTQHGQPIHDHYKPANADEIDSKRLEENPFCGASIMVRRKAYEEVGGYREYFSGKSNEDYDWALRLTEAGKAANLDQVLYFYRMLPASDSRDLSSSVKLYSRKIVIELAKQRASFGADWIQKKDYDSLEKFENELAEPYQLDPSLSYREWAANFMYRELNQRAILSAWLGCKSAPLKLVNWRTWFYCIRKTIFST